MRQLPVSQDLRCFTHYISSVTQNKQTVDKTIHDFTYAQTQEWRHTTKSTLFNLSPPSYRPSIIHCQMQEEPENKRQKREPEPEPEHGGIFVQI